MERKGAILSEHISFGLSAGLNFMVQIEETIAFRSVRELHCLTNFIQDFGVEVIEFPTDCYYSFLINIKENIDKNMPIMVEYDGFYFSFTQIYQKKHEKRIAMIVGYDKNNLYISDFIYHAYEVPISLDLFEQAVTPAKGACVKPKWYDVYLPEHINKKITSELVYSSIEEVYTYFTAQHGSTVKNMIGLEGVQIFIHEIQELMSHSSAIKVDWLAFSEDIKQSVITFHHYGDFIADISSIGLLKISQEKANEISNLFYSTSASWRVICNLLFKFGLTEKGTLSLRVISQLEEFKKNLEKAFLLIKKEILYH